jgi:tetratricopeptide (TPR) repeat protein
MPGYTIYQVPDGFTPNPNLQRLFVQTILRRARNFIADPTTASFGVRVSDPEEMWLALTRLQGRIQQSLPDLASASETARANLEAKLSPDSQHEMRRKIDDDNPPNRTFDEQVEAALKNPNVDRRDEQLTFAILHGSKDETLDHVLDALDKISDSSLRQPLLNLLYFDRAQDAIRDQKLGEARKLAAKVDELDQRAFLYSRIAEELLKERADATQAHEILDEVLDATAKAPNTMVKVRALLGVAYLYTKFDMDRAIEVISQAVQSINRIEKPDFTRQFVVRKIEGRTFASFASFSTPGFTPENAFREIGKVDFDSMLSQASNFSDKSLRATMTLAVVEQCLSVQVVKPKSPNKSATIYP